MTDRAYLLSFDEIDATQRAQIQTAVAHHASDWFHQQQNVWIVLGGFDTPGGWRTVLRPFVDGVPGTVLIFELPEKAHRRYAGFAKKSWWTWLNEVYLGRGGPTGSRSIGA